MVDLTEVTGLLRPIHQPVSFWLRTHADEVRADASAAQIQSLESLRSLVDEAAVIGAILTAILINQSSLLAVRQMRDNSAFAAQGEVIYVPQIRQMKLMTLGYDQAALTSFGFEPSSISHGTSKAIVSIHGSNIS